MSNLEKQLDALIQFVENTPVEDDFTLVIRQSVQTEAKKDVLLEIIFGLVKILKIVNPNFDLKDFDKIEYSKHPFQDYFKSKMN